MCEKKSSFIFKGFELKLCSNGTYYVYYNGEIVVDYIAFDKFNVESANVLISLLNNLNKENEQLKIQLLNCEQKNNGGFQVWEVPLIPNGKRINNVEDMESEISEIGRV